MSLSEKVLAFRKSEWFRVAYLIALGGVLAALFPSLGGPAFCLVFLLMPITMFVVPYWLGERKVKRLAVNGLIVFAIAVLISAAVQAQTVVGATDVILDSSAVPESHPTMALSNGTVSPFRIDGGGHFNFTVTFTATNDSDPGNFMVWTDIAIIEGLALSNRSFVMSPLPGSGDARAGVMYFVEQDLDASVFGFGFSVNDRSGNWTFTLRAFGPITASWAAFYGVFLYYNGVFLLFPIVFYYFFIFMWWYSVRMKETRRRMLAGEGPPEKRRKRAKPGDTLDSRAKVTKAAAFTCTSCGADVTESDETCPKCGAKFED